MNQPAADIETQIQRGLAVLRAGGIVAFPTDTVYGLGASVDRPDAIGRIYEVKQRPRHLALPLLLADARQLAGVAAAVPPAAGRLAAAFWPGALTLVLPKTPRIPDIVTAGGATVAVRVPDHPVPRALVRGLGAPLVGTSANRSGQPSARTAGEVRRQLGDRVDFVIDGGPTPGGVESTIVDVTGDRPVVLREGALSREALRRVVDVS